MIRLLGSALGIASLPARDIETWTYNFGPNLLMRRIRFTADGTVASIETLGYGF